MAVKITNFNILLQAVLLHTISCIKKNTPNQQIRLNTKQVTVYVFVQINIFEQLMVMFRIQTFLVYYYFDT